MNKKVTLTSSLLLGIVALSGLVSLKVMAGKIVDESFNVDSPTAGVSCYAVGPSARKQNPQEEELENAKNQLESLYIEEKINEETYNTRMEKINAQLKKLQTQPKIKEKVREAGYDE